MESFSPSPLSNTSTFGVFMYMVSTNPGNSITFLHVWYIYNFHIQTLLYMQIQYKLFLKSFSYTATVLIITYVEEQYSDRQLTYLLNPQQDSQDPHTACPISCILSIPSLMSSKRQPVILFTRNI